MIALKPVRHKRALEVVIYNPTPEDVTVHRLWPILWRVGACALFVAGVLAVIAERWPK